MDKRVLLVEQARMRLRNSEHRLRALQRRRPKDARKAAISRFWEDILNDKILVRNFDRCPKVNYFG